MTDIPQPIFILASPRSYTSLVCGMLGQHPQAYGVPELNLFLGDTLEGFLQEIRKQPRKLHGLLRVVAQLYAGEQTLSAVEMAKRWIISRLSCSSAEIYCQLGAKVAPCRIVDKSPAYSLDITHLYRIGRAFPQAHFVHLVRHPRAQGESLMRLMPQVYRAKQNLHPEARGGVRVTTTLVNMVDIHTDPPTIDFQYLWYRMQYRIREFFQTLPPDRKLVLRGEDLLGDPHRQFQALCTWLGLSWSETDYQAMVHPEESPYASFGPLGANLGNDPNFLRNPHYQQRPIKPSSLEGPLPWRRDQAGFLPAVVQMAQEYGYQ